MRPDTQNLELFYPEPGDQAAEQAAKAICAACPVREACLDMALASGDQHAVLGGTTPAERIPLHRQRQVIHARKRAAERATAATGIDPADIRGPVGRSMRAHLFWNASAAVRAWELCKTAGTSHVAALIGVHVTDLHAALARWGLEIPNLHKPAELVHDPVKAQEAFALVEQVGWVKAAREVGVARRTLRAAFAQWGMGGAGASRSAGTDPAGDRPDSGRAGSRVGCAGWDQPGGRAVRSQPSDALLRLEAVGAGAAERPARGCPAGAGAEAGSRATGRPRATSLAARPLDLAAADP